jgi:hypothetical protein
MWTGSFLPNAVGYPMGGLAKPRKNENRINREFATLAKGGEAGAYLTYVTVSADEQKAAKTDWSKAKSPERTKIV